MDPNTKEKTDAPESRWAVVRRFWSPSRRAYLFSAYATYAAVILAILPPLLDPRVRSAVSYDPTLAVLTATLIALIWTAYHTFQGVQHARLLLEREETKRERDAKFFLEALAEEMTHLDRSLSMIEGMPRLGRFDFLQHPILDDCLKRSDLFSPSTAAHMANVASALRPLPEILKAYRPDPQNEDFSETVVEIIRRSHASLRGLATNLVSLLDNDRSTNSSPAVPDVSKAERKDGPVAAVPTTAASDENR